MKKRLGMSRQRYLLILIVLIALLISLGCVKPADNIKPYLVLFAFEEEGQLLSEQMTVIDTDTVLGRTVYSGKLSGQTIVLAESGVGMTNAAMTTQALIDRYQPMGVIFSGIAGAIDSTVHIGDIVACSLWAEHDYGYIGPDGFIPNAVDVKIPGASAITERVYFATDSLLYRKAKELSKESLVMDSIGDRIPKLIVGGVGVTGNTFIDQVEKRIWLSENFKALVTDMETSAVAQVCAVNGLPFIAFRSASDLAGGSGSASAKNEIRQFFQVAANNSAEIVVKYLESL